MKLKLQGIESHEDTELDISGNYVTVTGPNNIGKSTLIRAMLWQFYNAIRGSKFIRKGAKITTVSTTFDGVTVERIKGGKGEDKNSYRLNGKTLTDVDKDVPIEVSQALSIWPIKIDKDAELLVNVVRQKDHPFLMDENGTVKAKVLNALTGHNVLDVALRETATIIKRIKTRKTELDEQVAALLESLKEFVGLEARQEAVAQSRTLIERVLTQVEYVKKVRQYLSSLDSARQTLVTVKSQPTGDIALMERLWDRHEQASLKKDAVVGLEQTKQNLDKLKALIKDSGLAQDLWARYEAASSRMEALVQLYEANNTLVAAKRPLEYVSTAEALWAKFEAAVLRRDAVLDLSITYNTLATEQTKFNSLQVHLDRSLGQFQMLEGTVCLSCGQTLTKDSLCQLMC